MKIETSNTVIAVLEGITQLSRLSGKAMHGWSSIAEFVMKNGVPMTKISPCPKGMMGRMRECYKNATDIVLNDWGGSFGYTYCEGFALGIIPCLHAWLLSPDGEVIDPTWHTSGGDYYGIAIHREYLVRSILKSESYGLIDQPPHFPMLKDKPETFRADIMDRL